MNKPVYLGLLILDLSKTVMYEFWYDFVKPEYAEMQKFVIWIQADSLHIYKQIVFIKVLQKILK